MSTLSSNNISLWGVTLRRFLYSLALLIMLFHLFVYVVYSVEIIRFPFDYDQGEGFELVDTVYLSEGKSPYRNNETFPFYASNYPPVYHVVLIPFAWLFGPEYWYGRLVSFIGTLITAGAIGYAIRRSGGRREIAVLMGLAFLASNYIYHIGPLFRQHYFMVMFETLAVIVLANLMTLPPGQQQKRLWLGFGLLVVAGYTKQLAVFTVAAVFIWLFIQSPRRAVLHAIGFAGVTGLIFLLLNVVTEGEWWKNVVAANVNQFIPSQFTGLFRQFMRLHWVLILFAGLMLLYELYFDRLSLYAVWLVITLASTVGSGTWGAGDSYFATALVAACILGGIFISRTLDGSWQFPDNYLSQTTRKLIPHKLGSSPLVQQSLAIGCMALMVVYGLSVIKMPTNGAIFEPLSEALGVEPNPGHRYPYYDSAGWTPGYATIGHIPSQQDIDNGWLIVERVRASDKPVMSEEAAFSFRADREVISNPTQLQNVYDNGLLDPAPIVNFIEDQGFGLIIFRARFYPEPVLAAVDDAYYPREVIEMNGFSYELWYPEPTWEQRRQVRNFLENRENATESVSVTLSQLPENPEQWVIEMMGRWAWVPVLTDFADLCDGQSFTRRGQTTTVQLCDSELTVSAPVALN